MGVADGVGAWKRRDPMFFLRYPLASEEETKNVQLLGVAD